MKLKTKNYILFKKLFLGKKKIFFFFIFYAELIHFLGENHVQPEDNTYQIYLEESIKCHHNNFVLYFLNNLITLHYHSFAFFPNDPTSALLFSNACKYIYKTFIKISTRNEN